ncbi:hypothetical protein P3S67_027771 [Capsicum chacoense]
MTPDMEDSDSDDQFVYGDDGWKKYSQQLQESEGFDIKDYPGADPRVTIFPRTYYLECPSNVNKEKCQIWEDIFSFSSNSDKTAGLY